MNKLIIVFLLTVVSAGWVYSQQNYYAPFSLNPVKTNSVSKEIKESVDNPGIVDINFSEVSRIVNLKSESISVSVPYKGSSLLLDLKKFDILTPGAKIVAGTENGDKIVNMNNSFVVYTSDLYDKNAPLVIITFFENEVSAFIAADNDIFILSRLDKDNLNSDYIFFQNSKLKSHKDFNCGAEGLGIPEKITQMQKNISANMKDFSTSQLLKANIAIESDFDTFTYFGGTENATRYILRLLAPVSALYIRDMNVQLQSSYLRVWSTSADPYNGTTSSVLLNEFRNYWNANMSSVPRTLAHYITTRPGGLGGIAWVGVLCANLNSGYGYAFSDIDGTFNNLPAYSWDVMVVSHETGHNFGSPHTHNCSWPGGPIDSCYTVEGGCYTGPPIARVGTIMSYCHLNGSIALNFGTLPSNLIRSNAESAPCLNNLTGFLVATPNGGEVIKSGQSSIIIWGTNYVGNVNIEYTSNNGSNWNTIQNNVDASVRYVDWLVPYIPTTDQAKVRVYQTGNTSNSDQSDSSFQIRPTLTVFSLVDPPQLFSTSVYQGDTAKINFRFTKTGTLPEINYKWFMSTINYSHSYTAPSNNNGSDTVCSVSKGILDSLMNSWGAVNIGDSLRVRWFVRGYSQYDSTQSNNSFLITLKRGIIGIQPVSTVIPKEYFVNQNYPNPFNPVTNIKFGIPKSSIVKISVYDMLGQEISVLVNDKLEAGEFVVDWNAVNFPSGIYFYKIQADNYVKTSRMVLVK